MQENPGDLHAFSIRPRLDRDLISISARHIGAVEIKSSFNTFINFRVFWNPILRTLAQGKSCHFQF